MLVSVARREWVQLELNNGSEAPNTDLLFLIPVSATRPESCRKVLGHSHNSLVCTRRAAVERWNLLLHCFDLVR